MAGMARPHVCLVCDCQDGDLWRQQRKVSSHLFSTRNFKKGTNRAYNRVANNLVDFLRSVARIPSRQSKAFIQSDAASRG
jgi:hypothetical protein